MIYVYIAVLLAFLGLGAYAKIEHSGKLAAEAKVEAKDAEIRSQNAAIAATKAEGDRRVADAKKGAAKAAVATQEARTEAERLRVAAKSPAKPGACPAADAVAEVRKGL